MRRRAALAGMLVACAIGVGACGGGGGAATLSIKTLQAAVDNTQAAESSRFTMDLVVGVAGEQTTIHASGVSSGDGMQMQISLGIADEVQVEERLVDQTIYMDFGSVPGAAGKLPAGKSWVKIGVDSLKNITGLDYNSLLDQAQSSSPTQGLEYLQGLSGDVEKVGDDTVAGAHATHYRASIDYAKVAAKLPPSDSDVTQKLQGLGTVPADVWIDDQVRVVKMHFAIDGAAAGSGVTGTAELTMEMTGFGEPVNVVAPPADQTIDISELGASLGQSGSQFTPVGDPLS